MLLEGLLYVVYIVVVTPMVIIIIKFIKRNLPSVYWSVMNVIGWPARGMEGALDR